MPASILAAMLSLVALAPVSPPDDLPVVEVVADDTVIDRSCRVRIAPGRVIVDAADDGVVKIVAPNIVVEFEEGAVLAGSPPGVDPDRLAGTGIVVRDVANVTIRHPTLRGFKVGILADRVDRLVVERADLADLFRQRLRSTPAAEDASDWLWPHDNDDHEWRRRHGAAICIERSRGITLRDALVRRSQNGIILDRVEDSSIYDNDCSFLSGWGLAMWRSSRNTISRNAFDFCVRGHSEGVYNRGQDSAGILAFEQCRENRFIENSATHGGDGFFGFAGREALGQKPPLDPATDPVGRGCDDNLLLGNDFSFASAHGIEMTFSRRNRLVGNRVVGNGICGFWGGYSIDSLILRNHFERNGQLAYGLERGAINIEHGSRTRIERNTFLDNRCAIHLWWDDDKDLLASPGVKALGGGRVDDTLIAGNIFTLSADPRVKPPSRGDARLIGAHLRDTPGGEHVKGTIIANDNMVEGFGGNQREFLVTTEGITIDDQASPPPLPAIDATPLGRRSPVGARARLAGREHIVVGPWGPWDHVSPMILAGRVTGPRHTYVVYGATVEEVEVTCDAKWSVATGEGLPQRVVVAVSSQREQAATPYDISIASGGETFRAKGMLLQASWECAAFSWSTDPREDLEKWHAERQLIPQAVVTVDAIDFPFGSRGPRDLPVFRDQGAKAPGPDRFGMVCVSTMDLPAGRWKFATQSDDGVRVTASWATDAGVQRRSLIDRWTWHARTTDAGVLELDRPQIVTVRVEYFELDGDAVLKLDISPD
ncbi:MAG: right-handed parallel beta-helix repeat-containing protein [Phycisphaerae bacterium]